MDKLIRVRLPEGDQNDAVWQITVYKNAQKMMKDKTLAHTDMIGTVDIPVECLINAALLQKCIKSNYNLLRPVKELLE